MPASGHRNKVIGQAGEFAVCAQLGKLGLVATPFAGNVPVYDLIVIDEAMNSVPVQVKTSFRSGRWIAGDIRTYIEMGFNRTTGEQLPGALIEPPHPDLLMVYVLLSANPGEVDRFFIMTRRQAWAAIAESYVMWLEKKGGKRPRKSESYHCIMGVNHIEQYKDNWKLLRSRLTVVDPVEPLSESGETE